LPRVDDIAPLGFEEVLAESIRVARLGRVEEGCPDRYRVGEAPENAASAKVLTKNGFERVDTPANEDQYRLGIRPLPRTMN